MKQGFCANLLQLLHRPSEHAAHLPVIKGIVVVHRSKRRSKPGKSVVLQLHSGTHIDQSTGRGTVSSGARLKHAKKTKHGSTKTVTYRVSFHVEPGFGVPGAVLVKSGHRHEFFLSSVTLETEDGGCRVHFDCNSWVYPLSKTKVGRVFFSNTVNTTYRGPARFCVHLLVP